MRALALGVAMTLALLGLGGSLTWGLYQRAQRFITRDLRLRTLLGDILRLDEVLTMSARMAAATGDLKWEARYHQHEPLIDAEVAEVLKLSPPGVVAAIKATENANLALVNLEHRAFELVRAGRQPEAAALLDSNQYALQKDIYSEGVEKTKRAIAKEANDAYEDQQREVQSIVWVAVGALMVLGFAWKVIISRLLEHRSASAAQVALAAANRDLDARVKARTAELSEANTMLEHSLERHAATQRELMNASRKAGMAEVATGVLHNVGNVLNSVNVSCATVADAIRRTRLDGLNMASELLRSGDADEGAAGARVSRQGQHPPRRRTRPSCSRELDVAVEEHRPHRDRHRQAAGQPRRAAECWSCSTSPSWSRTRCVSSPAPTRARASR